MVNPRQAERRSVVRATIANPVLLVAHSWACASFLAEYASNRLRRRWARDLHAAGKHRPSWLPVLAIGPSISPESDLAPLILPVYPSVTADATPPVPDVTALPNQPGDIESYFATHRWSQCQHALFGSDTDVASAVRQCVDWLRAPLPRSDPAWEPYSTSERVANLVVLLSARPAARAFIGDDVLRGFLQESLQWIDGHLEYYGDRRTNNHILNDARAMVIAGALLRRDDAVELGLHLFARMGAQLFQAGGFLRERSAHYQLIVANWLFDTVHFGRLAAVSSASVQQSLRTLEELSATVARATAVLCAHVDHCDSWIGDISPDAPPAWSRQRLSLLYPSRLVLPAEGRTGQIDDWIFLDGRDQSVVACTILDRFPPVFTTHGHSDLTHFVWRWRDVCVLADAGRARYTKDPTSLAQTDARGHNVVLIDGLGPLAESLVQGGFWQVRPYANALVNTRVDAMSFTVSHDGFKRLRGAGGHSRTVSITEFGIAVVDRIEGAGTVTLDVLWHFSPHLSPVAGPTTAIAGAGVVVSCDSMSASGDVPDASWQTYTHSSAYGDMTPASLLRLRWVISLPCTIHTTMSVASCAA